MRRLLAALFALVLLGLVEIAARLVYVPDAGSPSPDGEVNPGGILLDGNPWLLWELVPGAHEELGTTVQVNALGMRDRDRGPKTGRRALALGDSSVYGWGVPDERVFTAVLEAETGEEFVNLAVPGHSSYQQLNLLLMRGLALDPDLLIVANLWSDNNFDSFTDKELLASYAGWEASTGQRVRRLLEHSAVFRLLDWQLRVKPQGERARKVGWMLGGTDTRTGNRRVAINDYAANLEAFARIMADRGGGVVYVILPNREDLASGPADPAWGPYRRVMRETAERWGAPLVDLPAVFEASGLDVKELVIDEMHPTVEGHRRMAVAIGEALAPGWPVLTEPSSPLPTYEDPYEGSGLEAAAGDRPDTSIPALRGTLTGDLRLPPGFQGRVLVDVRVPGDRAVLGQAVATGEGPLKILVPSVPEKVVVEVMHDRAGDGPTPGDPTAVLPEQPVGPDRALSLDFSGAKFTTGPR
ncbi:MAG: SGNH/GDSL hydrolase family protein [Myxococcota bacterium]